jgi:hypothetical protein
MALSALAEQAELESGSADSPHGSAACVIGRAATCDPCNRASPLLLLQGWALSQTRDFKAKSILQPMVIRPVSIGVRYKS